MSPVYQPSSAANFLDKKQLHYGEFRSCLANDEGMEGKYALVDSCIFVTSSILYALRFLDDPSLIAVKRTPFKTEAIRDSGRKKPIHILD